MNKENLNKLLKCAAIAGNFLFILWLLFNGMDEGFKATLVQKLSYASLITLLLLNSWLLLKNRRD